VELITYPNPLLNQVSEECRKEDIPYIKSLIPEMHKIMNANKGIGLAAVQVGVLKRFCIMQDNSTALGSAAESVDLIVNPKVIEIDCPDPQLEKEGCLSLPGFWELIERPYQVTVQFMDIVGDEWIERKGIFYGIKCRCILHEIDHMNGQPIHNKVSVMKREMWKKKLKKKGVI